MVGWFIRTLHLHAPVASSLVVVDAHNLHFNVGFLDDTATVVGHTTSSCELLIYIFFVSFQGCLFPESYRFSKFYFYILTSFLTCLMFSKLMLFIGVIHVFKNVYGLTKEWVIIDYYLIIQWMTTVAFYPLIFYIYIFQI